MASPGADPLNPATDTGSSHTGSGMEAAKENAEHLTERVKNRAADLKRKAEDTVQDVGVRARSASNEQKNVAAERVGGVAHALRVASDDLRDRGQPMVAEYSRPVADGLESMAQSLSRRSVDDLVGGIEDFARQRRVAFMGGTIDDHANYVENTVHDSSGIVGCYAANNAAVGERFHRCEQHRGNNRELEPLPDHDKIKPRRHRGGRTGACTRRDTCPFAS
jgi:hypothetical protein